VIDGTLVDSKRMIVE